MCYVDCLWYILTSSYAQDPSSWSAFMTILENVHPQQIKSRDVIDRDGGELIVWREINHGYEQPKLDFGSLEVSNSNLSFRYPYDGKVLYPIICSSWYIKSIENNKNLDWFLKSKK